MAIVRLQKPWGELSGSAYVVARIRNPQRGKKDDDPFQLRVFERQGTFNLREDEGPCVWLDDEDSLISWQYDYDLFFDRTAMGRKILAKYGPKIDKFKNPQHKAHKL